MRTFRLRLRELRISERGTESSGDPVDVFAFDQERRLGIEHFRHATNTCRDDGDVRSHCFEQYHRNPLSARAEEKRIERAEEASGIRNRAVPDNTLADLKHFRAVLKFC